MENKRKFHTIKGLERDGLGDSLTLWRLVNTGRLKSFRIGRAIRISDEALQAFIAQGGDRSTAPQTEGK